MSSSEPPSPSSPAGPQSGSQRPRGSSRAFIVSLVVLALTGAAFLVPIPVLVIFGPGPLRDVERHVEVEGAETYSSEGSLYLTTVTVSTDPPFAEIVSAVLSKDRSVQSREALTGGQSLKQAEQLQRREMDISQRSATIVALDALDIAHPRGNGAIVAQVLEGYPAAEVLEEDDRIVRAQGVKVSTLCDVGRILGSASPGDDVTLTVVRASEPREVTLTTTENPDNPGRAFLGISMRPTFGFDTEVKVDFKTGRIAGPSAGMMFSLGLYDQLTPDDLTGGRRIAGTGTISCDGSVGPIGGIEEKIAAAEAQGAEIFITPSADAGAARAVADDIKIVPVRTFGEALSWLEGSSQN